MPNGTLDWKSYQFNQFPLQGYTAATCPSVIEMTYSIPSGTLKNGTSYTGTARAAYLPGT